MTSYKARCGEYGIERKVWVDKRLDLMPSAQAGIINDKRGTHLISYNTLVITIDPDGWMSCTGTYSQTTRRHINRFLREVAPSVSYQDAKKCYEDGLEMNVHTGEIRELSGVAAA